MNYNIIIIGANDNELQASHDDMCILMSFFEKQQLHINRISRKLKICMIINSETEEKR